MLAACDPREGTHSSNEITGVWLAEQCNIPISYDGGESWFLAKAEITFSPENEVNFRFGVNYFSSACFAGTDASEVIGVEFNSVIKFFVAGTEIMEDGLLGQRFRLQVITDGVVAVDRDDVFVMFLEEDRFCMSDNFWHYINSDYQSQDGPSSQVNYENCFMRGGFPNDPPTL